MIAGPVTASVSAVTGPCPVKGGTTRRKDRVPHDAPHALKHYSPGKNRFEPGRYVCNCGDEFSGLNKWEKHRAEMRRAEKERRDDDRNTRSR